MHLAGFTEWEELLEVLWDLMESGVRERFDEKAAIQLKLSPATVRTRLYRLRAKYDGAKRFCKEYRSWQQRLYQKSGGAFSSL